MEGRPTRRVYIEILTCAILFLNLEDSRRTWPEVEPGGSPAEGAHPRVEGVRPALVANHAPPRGLCSTASKDKGKPCDYGRFDPMAHVQLRGLYKQGLSTLGEAEKSLSEEAIKVRV